MSSINIKQTSIQDLKLIAKLDNYFTVHEQDHLQAIYDNRHRSARIGTELVGDIIFNAGLLHHWYVRLLHVHPAYRRQGIASELLHFAEQECEADKLFISTQKSNDVMLNVLKKCEYLPCGHIQYLNENPDDDELFFYKQLT